MSARLWRRQPGGQLVASQVPYLDSTYAAYLAGIAAGAGRDAGVQVGEQAAAAVLALRADDGFNAVVPYVCSSLPPPPGEFEPNLGCGDMPIGTNVSQMKPFTFQDRSRFRPNGPDPLRSNAYTRDFEETRDYGRSDSSVRTPEQTDIAYFWQFVVPTTLNNLVGLAISQQGLNVRDAARFLSMVSTAWSDAAIAGFDAKYHYRFWRPRTAIPKAAEDGNPDTAPDPTWTPLLSVNHPEYPSAHAFVSTATADVIARFFGTSRITWTLTAVPDPRLVRTQRTYYNLNALLREMNNARVWTGLHWRNSMVEGAAIGRRVAAHVSAKFFRRIDDDEE